MNRIPAHVTLFHSLPGDRSVRFALERAAEGRTRFGMRVDGLQSMGRGVTYVLSAPELVEVHRELAGKFAVYLTPQDRQPFRPHVVVQNKVEPAEARALLEELRAEFRPRAVEVTGLLWWEYMGGPWKLLDRFAFRADGEV